jgi:hypothetical protein
MAKVPCSLCHAPAAAARCATNDATAEPGPYKPPEILTG